MRVPTFPAHLSLCSSLSGHLRHFLSWGTLEVVSSLRSLLGCGLSYLSKGLNRRLLPHGQKSLLSSRMDGAPGTFSKLWVLQIPGLLLDGGSLALCKWLWASPPPLSWAPLAGNRRPILTLTAILSVSTWTRRQAVGPETIPLALPQCEGEEARSYPSREPWWKS